MTTAVGPLPQWRHALAKADEVRIARARLKRAIKAGEVSVADVLADIPAYAENMSIAELLLAQHRWGRRRVTRLCQDVMIAESRTLKRLTEGQRERVRAALRRRGR